MKNTLIELAKQSGMGVVNQYGLYIFKEDELTKFAELLQANSGNAVDERAAFEEWAEDEGLALSYNTHNGQFLSYWSDETQSAWKGWQARANKDKK